MKDVYFISGLGADKRLLQYLDIKHVHSHYIHWISPKKGETWEDYAKRLLQQIPTPNPIIIGVSMGGMMAIEISKLIPVEQIILISSAKTKHEIPPYFHLLKYFKIHRWFHYSFIMKVGLLFNSMIGSMVFGPKNKAEKKLLKEIIQDTDETFFKWAWDRVAGWENEFIPDNLTHIHGSRDHMLPIYFVHPHHTIKGGTHLMVFHKAEEISNIINKFISPLVF